MKLTNLLRMKLPEGKDPVNVEDFNDNFKAIDKELEQMQTSAGDASKNTVTFSTAAERTNVASTETLGTLMGKIAKWFTDMKAAAFAGIANNETTNTDGFVLDARIGKKHSDQLNGLYFGTDAKGKWGFKTSQGGTITPFRNPTGNAGAADVLSGKTFSSATAENVAGSMPNNGAWTGKTTGKGNVTIPAGYHSGNGYVSGDGAYNAGMSDADARVNEDSASYKSGYASKKLYRVAIGTGGDGTYSAAAIPGFHDFTIENFAFVPTSVKRTDNHWGNQETYMKGTKVDSSVECSMSYNSSNGVLTVTNLRCTNNIGESGGEGSVTGTFYCYYAA